ncbi:MAG: SDR family oxidoreductase [Candidatus Zixiibacteriota bacterium]
MNRKILVIGGTGMLGGPVVRALAHAEFDLRIMTRDREKARRLFGTNAEIIEGDVTRPESLTEAISGCQAVYVNLGAGMDIRDFRLVERDGTVNIARAAASGGVEHIGMISILNAGQSGGNNVYLNAKTEAELALMESGVPYTIFRCCWFFESLARYIVNKRAMIFGRQPHKFPWMAGSDYANMVVKALQNNEAKNRVFHVRGVEEYTLEEALRIFAEIAMPGLKITHTPLWMLKAFGLVSRNKLARGMIEFVEFYEKSHDPVAEDDSDRILGPALTTLRDWAEEYKRKMAAAAGD